MPLFKGRKTSKDEAKSDLERKLVWANDDPEPTFDISSCGTREIPSGVYSKCKVLRKEVLLMHNNAITDLKGGGELKHLQFLRVLDLHQNKLSEIPEEIRFLTSLQVLNLSHNHIKKLPNNIGKLLALQTLDLQGNELKVLPDAIGEMKSLRTLNVSHNKITRLPAALANVRTLENLIVDVDKIVFPSKGIAAAGTADMMKQLCVAAGIEYIPPSKCLLPVLDNTSSNPALIQNVPVNNVVENVVDRLEKEKERKRQEHLMSQQQLHQAQEEQALLAAIAKTRRDELLKQIAEDDTKTNEKILIEQNKKDKEIVLSLTALESGEQQANERVAATLQTIERSKRTEELLDEMEKERIQAESLFKVSQEEAENLRRKEVLESMNALLRSEQSQELRRREYESVRQSTTSRALQSIVDESRMVDHLLDERDKDQSKLLKSIENEERAQMEAFLVLQMQTDAKHKQITNQLELLEKELQDLSFLEMERQKERQEDGMRILETNRQALIDLFMQLLDERQKREEELNKRMIELEERREGEVEDYWLIQFQRLLDHKPESLVMKERECDEYLAEVLSAANAEDYVSNFVRNKITWRMLRDMNDENLKEIGIHEYGVRWKILNAFQTRIDEDNRANEKEYKLSAENNEETTVSDVTPTPVVEPSAPPLDSVEISQEGACVICMEAKRDVIFLLCGHVCCCSQCSADLKDCPMCRQEIVKIVRMFMV